MAALGLLLALPACLMAQAVGVRPHAQAAPAATNPLRLHANLVYVPVAVTTAEGWPVGSLDANNFLLWENGQPQTIRLFQQHAARPMSVVLAIDTSLSVQKDRSQEKQTAREFVHSILRRQDQLALIGFARQAREYVPFTHNSVRIDRALRSLRGDGPTALYAAIVQGAQMLETEAGRRVIVVISDGTNSMPGSDYNQARTAALRAEASIESVILAPIAANAGRNLGGEHALIQLSRDTGGQYFYVRERGELQAALARLSQSLHGEYLLGYYAPPRQSGMEAGANEYRHIHVELTGSPVEGPLDLHFRTGYFFNQER